VRSGGTHLGAGESWGSRENGSAGCVETGEELSVGELTPVWVPDPAQEALRDLVRAREADAGISPRQEMRIYGGWLWKPRGPTGSDRPWGQSCGSGKRKSAKRSKRSLGKHNIGCIGAIESCWARARTREL
jgi:hypothetical protein